MNQNIQINLDDLSDIKCKCGSELFIQCFIIKKLSPLHPAAALMVQTQGHNLVISPTFICMNCGENLEVDIPNGIEAYKEGQC